MIENVQVFNLNVDPDQGKHGNRRLYDTGAIFPLQVSAVLLKTIVKIVSIWSMVEVVSLDKKQLL